MIGVTEQFGSRVPEEEEEVGMEVVIESDEEGGQVELMAAISNFNPPEEFEVEELEELEEEVEEPVCEMEEESGRVGGREERLSPEEERRV